MKEIDGIIRNLFPKHPSQLTNKAPFKYTGTWACDYLNESPEAAFAYIGDFMESNPKTSVKLRFLFECRTCIEYALEDIELKEINQYHEPECCAWLWDEMPDEELQRIKCIYQSALIKVDKAICLFNSILQMDCEKIDCFDLPNKEVKTEKYTLNQKVLLFYFAIRYMGITPRVNMDISPLARVMHALFDIEFTKIQNSDLYKSLRKAPNVKSDLALTRDLEVVKNAFLKVGLDEVVQQIDNEISMAKKERQKRA